MRFTCQDCICCIKKDKPTLRPEGEQRETMGGHQGVLELKIEGTSIRATAQVYTHWEKPELQCGMFLIRKRKEDFVWGLRILLKPSEHLF